MARTPDTGPRNPFTFKDRPKGFIPLGNQITNKINGKIYVGVHATDDLNDGYMGSGKLLKRSQAKYGLDAFWITDGLK